MWPSIPNYACSNCLIQHLPRISASTSARISAPWLGSRSAGHLASRARPSRMVLSKQVSRPPATSQPRKVNPKRMEGPFGAMNQTVARIPERKRAAASRSDVGQSKSKMDRRDPRKALKMQRALASIPYGKRTSIRTAMSYYESFDQFELIPALKQALHADALKGMTDVKPTPAQRLAIPALLGQTGKARSTCREFLIAAETGSGKTLAYLLPAINALKLAEEADEDTQAYMKRAAEEKARAESGSGSKKVAAQSIEPHPSMARPRVVILVPTAELVDQVGAVAKSLAHMVKFRSEKISANINPTIIQRNLYSPRGIDLIIATPHLLASIADSDPNVLARVTHLIIDEADSLLDRSFTPVTTSIIDRARPSVKQLVFCSATIPKRLDSYLAKEYPDLVRITTPNLHAIPRRVQLGVIDVSKQPYQNNKNLACADAIYTIGKESLNHEGPSKDEVEIRRIMVFVNEREKTQEVADFLVSKGIDAVALHRDTPEQRQSEMLTSFTSSQPMRVAKPADGKPRGTRSLPNVKVIVATDIASRGIDTIAVRHVVLYDVPHTTIDFIHRLGRAGRMGRRGRGIVLVGDGDRRDVVSEVKSSMFMGQALV